MDRISPKTKTAKSKCCIHGCGSNVRPLYRFPGTAEERFLRWVEVAQDPSHEKLTRQMIKRRSVVCSRHFTSEDFRGGERRLLKQDAVPSLYLPTKKPQNKKQQQQIITIDSEQQSPSKTMEALGYLTPVKEWVSMCESPRKRITPKKSRRSLKYPNETMEASVAHTSHDKTEHSIYSEVFAMRSTASFNSEDNMEHSVVSECVVPSTSSFNYEDKMEHSRSNECAAIPSTSSFNVDEITTTSTPLRCRLREDIRRKTPILKQLGIKKKKALFTKTEEKLYEQAKRLRKEVTRLGKKNRGCRRGFQAAKKLARQENFRSLFDDMSPTQKRFFESQIRNVHRKPKGRSFTDEEKADAIAIWKSSPKSYRLLSNMFAMPSVGTLRATLNSVSMKPGISKPIFEVLRRQIGQKKDPKLKLCTLSFDEMAIQPHLDYLPHEDRVVGFEDDGLTDSSNIADHVAVFMLRGICKRWKQPVAFAFCKSSMKAETIVQYYKGIITAATAIGLNVVASVCDQGANNRKAIRLLLAHSRSEEFSKYGECRNEGVINVSGHLVIPLFDPPHLLKSFRNNLLTKDLEFWQGGERRQAKWSHIQECYRLDQGGTWRSANKLTARHVISNKIRKMKVSLAAQVFSGTVGAVMKWAAGAPSDLHKGGSLPTEAFYTGELLCFMDCIFDSVNGGFERNSRKRLRGMVSKKSIHSQVWREGKQMFSKMRFVPSKPSDQSRPPVLDGWYLTLNGFLLIKDRLQKLGVETFPARAFNQDPLENFFGQIRQYGVRYTNPTCKAFIPFYKSLLIRNFSSYHSRGSNCEEDGHRFLLTINDFLQQKDVCDPASDQWQPPPVPDCEPDLYDRNTMGYVGGFLVNHISPEKYDCEICQRNLLHSGEPDPLHHQLVEVREYDNDKRRLRYMNVNVIKVLLQVSNQIKILVPSALCRYQICKRIISYLRRTIDFDFQECPHASEIKDHLFDVFLRVYTFGYTKKLSNIILGKEGLTDNSNQLEKDMYEIYLRHQRR